MKNHAEVTTGVGGGVVPKADHLSDRIYFQLKANIQYNYKRQIYTVDPVIVCNLFVTAKKCVIAVERMSQHREGFWRKTNPMKGFPLSDGSTVGDV